jgi:predicted RNase H-like HicB family nuclease
MTSAMRFTAAITREGNWYVAQCLEIEVASQGETMETALANLRETIELRLEDEPEISLSPEPPIIATVEVNARPPAP